MCLIHFLKDSNLRLQINILLKTITNKEGMENTISSSRTAKCSGLLIRQPLIWLHKFKSCTLRIQTFSNEKSLRVQTKSQVDLVHLTFFVLLGSLCQLSLTIGPNCSRIYKNGPIQEESRVEHLIVSRLIQKGETNESTSTKAV